MSAYPPEIAKFNPVKLRQRFISLYAALEIFETAEMTKIKLEEMVDLIQEEFRLKNREVIRESILYLLGSKLTESDIANCAWRICVNLPKLRKKISSPPKAYPTDDEMLLLQVVDYSTLSSREGNRRVLTVRSLVGETAAVIYSVTFSSITPLFRKIVNVIKGPVPEERVDLLYGLFFAATCSTNKYGGFTINPDNVICPPKLMRLNNEVVEARVKLKIGADNCTIVGKMECRNCLRRYCPAKGYILF